MNDFYSWKLKMKHLRKTYFLFRFFIFIAVPKALLQVLRKMSLHSLTIGGLDLKILLPCKTYGALNDAYDRAMKKRNASVGSFSEWLKGLQESDWQKLIRKVLTDPESSLIEDFIIYHGQLDNVLIVCKQKGLTQLIQALSDRYKVKLPTNDSQPPRLPFPEGSPGGLGDGGRDRGGRS